MSLRARLGTVFRDFMTNDLTPHENIALADLRGLDDPGAVRAGRPCTALRWGSCGNGMTDGFDAR